jgi:hypothetical protein
VSRNARLALLALSLVLLIFPLTLGKPGLPPTLKADEPAYYLMGLSLARDFDLEMQVQDVDRLFDDFPHPPIRNVIVMSGDGWNTVQFSKPLPYPLFAAPFAALFGANGYLFFNMLMVVGMIWMGAYYLRRFNDDGLAVIFAAAFVLLSVGFSYAFWIHPETFNMAAIALACFAASRDPAAGGRRAWLWLAVSGGSLALAVYNKPMYALVGLPLIWLAWKSRSWRGSAVWLGGAVASSLVVVGLALGLQGRPSPYLGGHQRQSISVCEPGAIPIKKLPETARPRPRSNWGYLLRIPDLHPLELLESMRDFMWGRHTGFLLYFPFGALCIVLLALEAPRDGPRWLLLAALTGVALYFFLFMRQNYQGGGGFLGNRYFVGVYPAFLYLVRAIRPPALLLPAAASASLFLMPILLTPFGRVVPFPTLQSHVRNVPFKYFPLEFSLKAIPGYRIERIPGGRMIVRRDQIVLRDRSLWLRGGDRVEVWFEMGEPLEDPVFLVESLADNNRIEVQVGSEERVLENMAAGAAERFVFDGLEPSRRRRKGDNASAIYKVVVTSTTGRIELLPRKGTAQHCGQDVGVTSSVGRFYVGAGLRLLGESRQLEVDVYDLEWGQVEAPSSVVAGSEFSFETVVINRSPNVWRGAVGARLNFSYHWLDLDGSTIEQNGLRTRLPRAVAPGEELRFRQSFEAPAEPGSYILELDPVFEHVAWFSDRNGGNTLRIPIEVSAAGEAP